ncbi:alpha beta hydrolase [Chlorella sorokiniana]|uniref:Alpha beta hydrolase n=1 Tax=Chlorella sorokiniana TaxID=3076 RepID=A0A2P6U5L3_CHLSO|nr:alpha beta hydrolase [Chlorella sorokiniana]|eukprot:PRW61572.1 alpha beta hydrolase [Chlorella sorokiniana]
MHGEKARELQLFATRQLGCNYWALEYQGHGDSTQNFEECTLTTWLDDVLQLLDSMGSQRQFLVGSSMGAWLALHAALRRPHLVQGLLLLAPAVDISQHWQAVAQPTGVDAAGHELVLLPSAYVEGGGIRVRRQLLEEASAHHLLLHTGQLEALTCPATIMHSIRDDVVPLELVQRLADELQRSSRAFHLELLPDGNHRLSREQDLQLMCRLLGQLVQQTLEGMAL